MCTVCFPSGAWLGSSVVGMEMLKTLRASSTPFVQSSTTRWCMPSSLAGGKPAASMPKCRCTNESHRGVVSVCFSSPLAVRFKRTSAGNRLCVVSHALAFVTTHVRARITRPPRLSFMPTARPFSTTISSTGAPSATTPPCLRTPRASASMSAWLPPMG